MIPRPLASNGVFVLLCVMSVCGCAPSIPEGNSRYWSAEYPNNILAFGHELVGEPAICFRLVFRGTNDDTPLRPDLGLAFRYRNIEHQVAGIEPTVLRQIGAELRPSCLGEGHVTGTLFDILWFHFGSNGLLRLEAKRDDGDVCLRYRSHTFHLPVGRRELSRMFGSPIRVVIAKEWYSTYASSGGPRECINNLLRIDDAKERWAMETGVTNPVGVTPTWSQLLPYVEGGKTNLLCPWDGVYEINELGRDPTCSCLYHCL